MRSNRFFTSTIHFFSGVFFVLFGLLTLMIPSTPSYRAMMISLLAEGWLPLTIMGILFIALGIILLQLITVRRRSYYQLRSGEQAVTISESLIEESLKHYWTNRFDDKEVFCDLAITKKGLHITLDFPHVELRDQKDFIKRAENDVKVILDKTIGYQGPFHLSASFQQKLMIDE